MKKVISAIAASVLAVSAFPISSVSATNVSNTPANDVLSMSTEVLETSITVDDAVIPAGATAVTVNVSNNTGFDSSATKINIGNANVIVDENGNPIFSVGDVLEDTMVVSAKKDNFIVVTSASADETFDNGEMFTFYVSGGSSRMSIVDIEEELLDINAESNRSVYSYFRGDVHHDAHIDASDASTVLHAISLYTPTQSQQSLTVAIADANLSTYFPLIHYADAADTNQNGKITSVDADYILAFFSKISVGYTWNEALEYLLDEYGNHTGELVIVNEP